MTDPKVREMARGFNAGEQRQESPDLDPATSFLIPAYARPYITTSARGGPRRCPPGLPVVRANCVHEVDLAQICAANHCSRDNPDHLAVRPCDFVTGLEAKETVHPH